jgi:hypothetical protein
MRPSHRDMCSFLSFRILKLLSRSLNLSINLLSRLSPHPTAPQRRTTFRNHLILPSYSFTPLLPISQASPRSPPILPSSPFFPIHSRPNLIPLPLLQLRLTDILQHMPRIRLQRALRFFRFVLRVCSARSGVGFAAAGDVLLLGPALAGRGRGLATGVWGGHGCLWWSSRVGLLEAGWGTGKGVSIKA